MHVTFCIGMAMIMTPLMTASLGSLPRALYGHGSAIVNTLQQLAGATGTAILIAAMSIGASKAAADGAGAVAAQVTGTREAFVLGGIVGPVAVVSAPFVSRPRRSAADVLSTAGSSGTSGCAPPCLASRRAGAAFEAGEPP